ncbi:MAG: sulfite exporter TauE/SafE family protein [Arcobacteraceae bacterium]|nr:sulfite exporter TauE/SafE family protein [Arcobacteraceae bacterium]
MTLILLGILTGLMSGFFGVGGGTILVPLLLLYGFEMKSAVAISIMQMIFSSIYGSFLNSRKNKDILKDGVTIGIGGFLGGSLSGIIVPNVPGIYLKYIFIVVIIFSIYRVAITSTSTPCGTKTRNKFVLIFVGFIIGMIAMSIGIGGSVILAPILVGYMLYNLKDAASLGLFFVIFSSIAGFISLSLAGHMHYEEGLIVGLASLIGVYVGIKLKNIINIKYYKQLMLFLYSIILVSVIYKI